MSSEPKLFYSREDYDHAIKDAISYSFNWGVAVGIGITLLVLGFCLIIGLST